MPLQSGLTPRVKAPIILVMSSWTVRVASVRIDRLFVHRLRMVTGKDGNPLNEVEMICDSLMNNDGVLREKSPIKYVPHQSVVKLDIGDQIRLTAEEFEPLTSAFFAELESKFLQT